MSARPSVGGPAPGLLIEQLLQATEALASVGPPDDTVQRVLHAALQALNGHSGALLLVDALGRTLEIAATQGQDDRARTNWAAGPLDAATPAGDAIERRQPLFFEQSGELVQAYPELEARTGATAPVASAVLPMFVDGLPMGALVLNFEEPHAFALEERHFLQILATQGAVALGRARALTQLRQQITENEALEAFTRFTEASADTTEVTALVDRAAEVLRATLGDVSVAHYDLEDGLWRVKAWSSDVSPAFLGVMQRGLAEDFPRFAAAVQTRQPWFVSGWNAADEGLPVEPHYPSVVSYPYFIDGHPVSMLSVGVRNKPRWTSRGEGIIRAVGRSLGLALERAHQTRQLQEERAGLDAFVAFTEAVGSETDVLVLARQAAELVQAQLTEVWAVYFELEGQVWRGKVWSTDVAPEVADQLRMAIPLHGPDFAQAAKGGAAVFTNGWDAQENQRSQAAMSGAGAFVPLSIRSGVHAIFAVGKRVGTTWTPREQAIVRATGRSLGLALERADSMQLVQSQRTEMEHRNRALEAFSQLTELLDVRLDRYTLVQRAQVLALSLLPPGYAAYFEPEDGLWRVKSQVGDAGHPALQAAINAGFPVGATPTLDQAMKTGEPYFLDVYAKDTDIDAEVAGHLNAAACLPVFIRGQFIGIFNIPLFETRQWNATDRAVLISALQSLTLALEGAHSISELAERTEALERSNWNLGLVNEDLEAFTYSVSHDLRTPVRHVMGFAELAQQTLRKNEPDRTDRYLDVVKSAALRMTTLIDGMLALSKSGQQALRVRAVALSDLVAQAQRDVAEEFPDHPVVWMVEALPVVAGDRGLLQQVMTNLFSNAVKYSSTREHSEIRVWATDHEAHVEVFVQDNGVGFDPQYAHRLFGIFQRLHDERDFAGTGIGLANVRRIVQKHGGQVRADSRPGQGATFSVTLPRTPGVAT